jgi:hypothetical protein
MGTGGRRLEHDYATRRNRHRGAGLRVTVDTLTFLEIFRHGSAVSESRLPGDAHRGIGMRAWFTHPFINVT